MRRVLSQLLRALLIAGLAARISSATAAQVRDVVREAIAKGEASAALTDVVAVESRRRLNATGALHLSVSRLFEYQQQDCARLQLSFTQKEALLPGDKMPRDYSWASQMSVCASGQPPANTRKKT